MPVYLRLQQPISRRCARGILYCKNAEMAAGGLVFCEAYYAGFVVYKGDIYPGRHEPIISQAIFDRVQDVLKSRSGRGSRDRVLQHYLKGALFCERCHRNGRVARLIYTQAKGRSRRYGYFLCRGRQEGLCDLPHLAVARVEQAIVDHYVTLRLGTDFADHARQILDTSLAEAQGSARELHASLNRRLNELDQKEARLIDLAADGALPTAKIRAKLNEIKIERSRVEAQLTNTTEECPWPCKSPHWWPIVGPH